MKNDHLTIREMCDLFDVTPRTLRFYEAKELLSPIRNGTQRLFTRRDQVRTKLILKGKRFGFSLEEIRQLLNLYDKNDAEKSQLKEAHRLAKVHLEEMHKHRLELTEAITELRQEMSMIADRLRINMPGAHQIDSPKMAQMNVQYVD